eukprot:m.464718 g.464718  ORF g.464718 m.464718 type:complete len:428 (-) comp21623_c0_seq1:112-1395(-)
MAVEPRGTVQRQQVTSPCAKHAKTKLIFIDQSHIVQGIRDSMHKRVLAARMQKEKAMAASLATPAGSKETSAPVAAKVLTLNEIMAAKKRSQAVVQPPSRAGSTVQPAKAPTGKKSGPAAVAVRTLGHALLASAGNGSARHVTTASGGGAPASTTANAPVAVAALKVKTFEELMAEKKKRQQASAPAAPGSGETRTVPSAKSTPAAGAARPVALTKKVAAKNSTATTRKPDPGSTVKLIAMKNPLVNAKQAATATKSGTHAATVAEHRSGTPPAQPMQQSSQSQKTTTPHVAPGAGDASHKSGTADGNSGTGKSATSAAATQSPKRRRRSSARRPTVGNASKEDTTALSPTRTDSHQSEMSVSGDWYDELDRTKTEGARINGDDDFDVDLDDDLTGGSPPHGQGQDVDESDAFDDIDELLNDECLKD